MVNRGSGLRLRRSFSMLAATLAVGVLAACGSDPDELVASAKQYISADDAKSAAIQLKNALQERPEHAEARFLLGQLHAEVGDHAAALKEFERALGAGYPAPQVTPLLAAAMLRTGDYQKVIDRFNRATLSDEQANSALLSVVGDAYLRAGHPGLAQQAFEGALASAPKQPKARVGLARIRAIEKDFEGAKEELATVVSRHPDNADAHALLAEIAVAEGRVDDALAEYDLAIGIDPKEALHHFRLISILLREERLEAAEEGLAKMKKAVGSNNAYSIYLQAYVDFAHRRDTEAAEAIAKLLRVAPEFVPARMLAGNIYLRLGDVNQAIQHLGVVLSAQPENPLALRMMASAYLLGRNPDQAIEHLDPLLAKYPNDPTITSLAGQAYLAKGDFKRSAEYFEAAVESDPSSPAARVRLGVSQLGAGNTEKALDVLQRAASLDETGVQADVALSMARLRQGKFDEALAAIKRIEEKQPDIPLGPNLRGGAHLAKGDLLKAREAFGEAVALDPVYLPAVVNLARLDLHDKNPELARKRVRDIVNANPSDANAQLALIEILQRSGASSAEVSDALDAALEAAPDALTLKLALTRFHSAQGNHGEALAAAQQAQAAAPDDTRVIQALGTAQLSGGQAEQAVSSFSRFVSLHPNSLQGYMMLGRAQAAAGDLSGAAKSLGRAYQLAPEDPQVRKLLVALRIQQRDFDGAREIAADVLKGDPRGAAGHLLMADIAIKKTDWRGAVSSLRKALKAEPSPKIVIGIHAALLAAGDPEGAAKQTQTWLAGNPDDLVVPGYLAEIDLRSGKFDAAVARYLKMTKASPDNALLLNNLAWAASQAKDDRALEFARKAIELAPDDPAVLDTLGVIQLQRGDSQSALANLRRAADLAPTSSAIQLNLARALVDAGKKEEARAVLDNIVRRGSRIRGVKEEVAKLRAML